MHAGRRWACPISLYSTLYCFLGLFAMSTTSPSTDTPSFEPRPTLQYAATVGLQAALVGAFVSSVQNALGSHSKGASGFLSRTGGTIGFFGAFQRSGLRKIQGYESVMISASLAAAMGATFAATESIVANQREKQDALNGVAGGCAAGFLAGIRGAHHHTFPVPFRANLLCSSFPADSRCFLRGNWGCSGDVRHCWSIITRRPGGAVV